MIDPVHATNYHRTEQELEEFLLFCILVAGKNATVTAKNLARFLGMGKQYCDGSPFDIVNYVARKWDLARALRDYGFGCYNIKATGILEAANSGFNLKACTLEQLESVYGVGMKTARYFVLHSRKNANVACLDTHVLGWLAYHSGYEVPKSTPTSKKKYLELEQVFLKIAEVMKITPTDLDLRIWNKSRGSDEKPLVRSAPQKKSKVLDS